MRLAAFDAAAVNRLVDGLTAEAVAFARQGIGDVQPLLEQTAYMRYAGQGWEIPVEIDLQRKFGEDDGSLLKQSFEDAYRRFFGRPIEGLDAEIVSWSVRASSPRLPTAAIEQTPAQSQPVPHAHRRLFDAGSRDFTEAAIFHREKLPRGACVRGPAVIAERETSTILGRGFAAVVLADGCLLVIRIGSVAAAGEGGRQDAGRPADDADKGNVREARP
jgi:N-methylhydantoinase A